MNRTSHLARVALVGALVMTAVGVVGSSVAVADTSTTVQIAASSGADAPTPGYVFLNHKQFSITTSDGVGTLSGLNGGTFAVDDYLEIDTYTSDPSHSTVVYSHDFSNGCNNTGDIAIPAVKLALKPGVNLLELTLADRCGVDYGNPDLYLTVANGSITPVTTTTTAKPGAPTSGGGAGANLIVGPDLKAVSYLAAPTGCASQLKGDTGFAKVLSAACTYLSKSSDPKPAKTQTASSWAKLIKSKNYRGLLDLPPVDVVCTNGTALGAVATGNATYSTGYVRASVGSSAKVTGEKFLDAKGIFASHLPTLKLSKTGVVVTFRTAFRLPFVPDEYAATHHSAAFGYLVLQESIGCNGSYSSTATTSDLPSAVVYVNGKSFYSASQNATGLLAFVKAGGTGHAKTGHGTLDPHCKIGVVAGKVKVPAKPTTAQCTVAVTKGYLT